MNVTLTINGVDFAPVLDSYRCKEEKRYKTIVTTMDEREHTLKETRRDILQFRLMPMVETCSQEYKALNRRPLVVRYIKPHVGLCEREFRFDGDIDDAFLLESCDGEVRYSGEMITLRAIDAEEVT